MVSLGWSLQATPDYYVLDHTSTPRISFSSSEFLDESNFITICPNPEKYDERSRECIPDFEFLLSSNLSNMLSPDELFCEGKLLPLRQTHCAGKPNTVALKPDRGGPHQEKLGVMKKEGTGMSWFLDEDPSPRPPRCTVLWKELLRLKKQRGGCSSSSSSSSSSLSSSCSSSRYDLQASNKVESDRMKSRELRRGGRIRIRPMIHVPICSLAKSTSLSPTFTRDTIRVDVDANLHGDHKQCRLSRIWRS